MRHISTASLFLFYSLGSGEAAAQEWPSISAHLPPSGGGENDSAVVVGISKYIGVTPARPGQQVLIESHSPPRPPSTRGRALVETRVQMGSDPCVHAAS